jgi:hypothetical protein
MERGWEAATCALLLLLLPDCTADGPQVWWLVLVLLQKWR